MDTAAIEWSDYHREERGPVRQRPAVELVIPTVFIVAADPADRGSLEQLVEGAGWQLEGFSSAENFLARPRSTTPCCLVLDIGHCELDGLEIQRRLADRPEMPIIFLSSRGDVHVAVRAMKAGALEFLTRPLVRELLLDALRCGLDRSGVALARLADLRTLQRRHGSLTCREREVMALVVRGRLNKQVAGDLGISEITVKAHRGKVMRKMGVRTVPDLVNMAAKLSQAS